jgi:hypothetical protein
MELVDDDGTTTGDPSQDLSSGYTGRKSQESEADEETEEDTEQ